MWEDKVMKEDFFFPVKLLKISAVKIVQGVSLPLPYLPDKKNPKPKTIGRNQLKKIG